MMKTHSKVFLFYTILLIGVFTFIYLRYDPEIVECGTTVVQYDEKNSGYFYEIPTFQKKICLTEVDSSVYAGMPVSYVIYSGDDRIFESAFEVMSREQWEEYLMNSHRTWCLVCFGLFCLFGLGNLVLHWAEDAKAITVPVVGDR